MKRFLEILPQLLLSMLLLAAISGGLSAQDMGIPPMPGSEEGPPDIDLGGGFGEELSEGPLTVQAFIAPPEGETPAYLFVTVELDPGWHIYSMTQKGEGPIPTEIKVSPSPAIKKIG
ncbi:MAG: hypothetical protein PVH19_04905, partial [Planctomycetia bacterium]